MKNNYVYIFIDLESISNTILSQNVQKREYTCCIEAVDVNRGCMVSFMKLLRDAYRELWIEKGVYLLDTILLFQFFERVFSF